MKRAYSEYRYALKKIMKGFGVSAIEASRMLITESWGKETGGALNATWLTAQAESFALMGLATHYFIRDPAILDFFRDSVKEMDPHAYRLFLKDGAHTFTGVLNFPTSYKIPSILFVIGDEVQKPDVQGIAAAIRQGTAHPDIAKFSKVMTGGYCAVSRGWGDPEVPQTFWKMDTPEFTDDPEIGADQRLMAGFALYMKCFPHCVRPGVPEDLKHVGHYDGHKMSVNVVPEILQPHSGPCPHFRNGYFRTYRDERFVNVKGQTRFIEGVFVLGKAKTVDKPEEVTA